MKTQWSLVGWYNPVVCARCRLSASIRGRAGVRSSAGASAAPRSPRPALQPAVIYKLADSPRRLSADHHNAHHILINSLPRREIDAEV